MDHQYHHGGLEISPFLVGLLGVMAGALIVATLHCIKVCLCNDTQRTTRTTRTMTIPIPVNQRPNAGEADYREQASSSSGSFSNVQLIITSNYSQESKEDLCAVCLSEFNEGDEVRVLPDCMHTFHVSCVDKWLRSHRNCPLCRAQTLPSPRDVVCSLPHSGGVLPPELYRIPDYPS